MGSVFVDLNVLGSRLQGRRAILVAQCGNRMLLRTPDPVAPGALVEAHTGAEVILGEVVCSRVLDGGVELSVEAHHSFRASWAPHPAWQGGEAPESVLDSLCALNRNLESFAPASDPSREAPPSKSVVGD